VHAHRQQFLQRRAKFTEGAAQQTSDSKPTKRFEIELKALKLGEQKAVGKIKNLSRKRKEVNIIWQWKETLG